MCPDVFQLDREALLLIYRKKNTIFCLQHLNIKQMAKEYIKVKGNS